MPTTLPILFTLPQDLWDFLGTEGVDLREDDHNLASGQIIQTTSDTPAGSTSMAVAALPVALLNGAVLTFDSAGILIPVAIQLTAPATAGSTSLTIATTTADIPVTAQARDSGVNAATGARLLVGCTRGTSRVKLYCNGRYDDSQLKLCGTVNYWATLCAAKWLCTRRAQGCPSGIKADYDEAIEEMRMVQGGQLSLEDIGTRGSDWPTVTNLIVNPSYDGMRARVQPNISEQTPTNYSQWVDWNSAILLGI